MDIRKPANDPEDPNEFATDEDEENSNEENNFGLLFKRKKNFTKFSNNNKIAKNSSWYAGSTRMLQLTLSDGHQQCVGIEYHEMPSLNPSLIGAKCLLFGQFDVYLGTIFLTPANFTVVSDSIPVVPITPAVNVQLPENQNQQRQSILTNIDLNSNRNITPIVRQNSAPILTETELDELFTDLQNDLDDNFDDLLNDDDDDFLKLM